MRREEEERGKGEEGEARKYRHLCLLHQVPRKLFHGGRTEEGLRGQGEEQKEKEKGTKTAAVEAGMDLCLQPPSTGTLTFLP